MGLLKPHHDPLIGLLAGDLTRVVADIHRSRAERAARKSQAQQLERSALGRLKRQAVKEAISIVRLDRSDIPANAGLNDPQFKEAVAEKACSLLFDAHLHLSD